MGHGYPLWHPDPRPTCGDSEVQLGDIGYLDQGRFHLLFNCTRLRYDQSHMARRELLPAKFEPFYYDVNWIHSSSETTMSAEVRTG